MATWAIGDIQGCFHSFQALLRKIDYAPGRDALWLAGDLVNRGTGSLQMLRWAVAHADHIHAVMGNHEMGLLACAAGSRKLRKKDTTAPILQAPDCDELLAWVQQLPLVHVADGHVLVHAGLYPRWDLATCLQKARDPDEFARDTFTRMRTLTADMELNPRFAGPPDEAPDGCRPWFELRAFEPELHVLFGHWAALGVRCGAHWQSLDSGCVWGGRLTAYELQTQQLVSVVADSRDLVAPVAGGH